MSLVLEEGVTPTNDQLKEAIEIRCAECFPTLDFVNEFCGYETVPWKLVRKFTLSELLQEAYDRLLPVEKWKAAVTGQPIIYTKAFATSKHWQQFLKHKEQTEP